MALVVLGRGEMEEAIDAARHSIGMAEGSDNHALVGELHLNLAKVLAQAGRLDEAVTAARDALALFDRKRIDPAAARTLEFLTELEGRRSP
jgi:tetratricopeptide (TPR) repeat protein